MLGALITGILSTSYLGFINFVCCLGVFAGALAAVWHYTDTNELTIPTGKGATLGMSAAVGGLVIATVLNLLLLTVGINHETAMQEWMISSFGDSMPPEQLEAMEAEMEAGTSIGDRVLGFGIGAAVFAAFGAIGGAIGAKVFKKGGNEPTELDVIEEL